MYFPTDDENKLMIQDVSYDEKELIETVNAISLRLGGKRVISREKYFRSRNQRIYKSITERDTKFFNASISSQYQMKPKYEVYYDEDHIIKSLLTLVYQKELIHDEILYALVGEHHEGLAKLTYEFPKFIDSFCFSSLYDYLKDSNNFNNPKYLEIIQEYLALFQFSPQKNYVTQEEIVDRYFKGYTGFEASRYGEMEFQIQQRIAYKNEKILSLKKIMK